MARRKKAGELRDSEVECGYCDAIIPEDALRCPKCGKMFSAAKKMMAFAIVVIVVIASMSFLAISYYMSGQGAYDNGLDPDGSNGGTSPGSSRIIKIELFVDQAPITTKNFIDLARDGKYNGVTFHRVIDDFMIQTGDFQYGKLPYSPDNPPGTGGHAAEYHTGLGDPNNPETWLIPDEFVPGLSHERGMLSMANRGPDTGGSQFFIVQSETGTPHLDGKHAIFGRVTQGMNYVDEIAGVPKNENDQPLSPVTMRRVSIQEEGGKTYALIEVDY